jgi:sensor histidine kinase regulating citrate/malate metabolism
MKQSNIKIGQKKMRNYYLMCCTYFAILISALTFIHCASIKEYADSEDGKKMIDQAKEKAKDKETQEKVKEIIKEKTK